jgi:hypothetical protein
VSHKFSIVYKIYKQILIQKFHQIIAKTPKMPKKKRTSVRPNAKEETECEEVQIKAENSGKSQDPLEVNSSEDQPKVAPNPMRISIAGLKLQPFNASNFKILPKGSLNIAPKSITPKMTSAQAVLDVNNQQGSPTVIAKPQVTSPFNISTAKVIPLSQSGIKFSQIKLGPAMSLSPEAKQSPSAPKTQLKGSTIIKQLVRPLGQPINSKPLPVKRALDDKSESAPKRVARSENPLIIPKEEPTTSKSVIIETQASPEYESRRSGLRGIKLDINVLLGRKEQKSPIKIAKLKPQAIVKVQQPAEPIIKYENQEQVTGFACKKCPLIFDTRRDFMDHRKIHTKANYDCDKCNQSFKFQSSFMNHFCDFWCNVCGKTISNKANLKIHMSYVHGIGDAKFYFNYLFILIN